MTNQVLKVIFVIVLLSPFAWASEPESTAKDELKQVVHGSNQFAVELYQRLSEENSNNVFVCPHSISSALAMTFSGADNQTRQQIGDVLHVNLPPTKLDSTLEQLRRSSTLCSGRLGTELRVANRLWGQQGLPFCPNFIELTRNHYGAEIARVDFFGQTEAARQTINSWVTDQTDGRIQELLGPAVLPSSTRLALTNAAYFKGNWTHEFAALATKTRPFQTSVGAHVNVPMMYQEAELSYFASDDKQILELPYGQDGHISMVVILPRALDGLATLNRQLAAETLNQWCDQLKPQTVQLYLPKLDVSCDFQLKSVLESMGIRHAFDPLLADFSLISREERLFLSAVIHKAALEVNEQGTVTTAATAAIAVTKGFGEGRAEPVVFRADHPFMLLIRDNKAKSILFMGQIANPNH